MKPWVLAGACGVLTAALVGACTSCESEPGGAGTSPSAEAGDAQADGSDARLDAKPDTDADSASDATREADADPSDCGPFQRPEAAPVDWEEYTGWSCGCRLYVPGQTGTMPDPIEWEPCESPVPSNLSCRWMKHTWKPDGGAGEGIFPKVWIDRTSGETLLQFDRIFVDDNPDSRYRLVGEADGPIRVAFFEGTPWNKGCAMGGAGVTSSRYGFGVVGDTWDGPILVPESKEGFVGGRLSEPYPDAIQKETQGDSTETRRLSDEWIVKRDDNGSLRAWTWDFSESHVIYDPAQDPDKLPITSHVFPWGKNVFVEVGWLAPYGVVIWSKDEGVRPHLRYVGDASRAIMNFATDGTDMVWTYGEGPITSGGGDFEKVEVMTAPYTEDGAEALANARRVRSDLAELEPDGWVVGCGYAARAPALGDPNWNALFIVRLSDGESWLIPGSATAPSISWANPLGISCEELFVTAEIPVPQMGTRILRIRLDSLGPGTPPD